MNTMRSEVAMSKRTETESSADAAVQALCDAGWRFYDGGTPDGDMVWVRGERAIQSYAGESEEDFDRRVVETVLG